MSIFLVNHSITVDLILGLREVKARDTAEKRRSRDSKPGLESPCTLVPACQGTLTARWEH